MALHEIYHRKLARVLDAMGGLYLVDDLITAINENRMQSFTADNSWAITQVEDFPRAKKLHVVAMVGDLRDGEALHDQVLDYAKEIGAGLVSAYGRRGWLDRALAHGWRVKARGILYHKDM